MVEAESHEGEWERAGRAAVRRPLGGGGVAACMVGICSHQSPSVIADEEEDGPGLLTGRVRGGQGLQITDLLTVQ